MKRNCSGYAEVLVAGMPWIAEEKMRSVISKLLDNLSARYKYLIVYRQELYFWNPVFTRDKGPAVRAAGFNVYRNIKSLCQE